MTKIVFMGTPDFAVPTLQALIDHHYDVCAVVTQPDKAVGRGKILTPPPVKVCAQKYNIPIYQPAKLKTEEMYNILSDLRPDLFIVIAYGKILRKNFLEIPRFGCLNLHASLLPKYRGAAPIQWAIINGEKETGVCLMKMDEGMDTGPVYAREIIPIENDETAETLHDKLSALSADILIKHLPDILNNTIQPIPQEGEHTTAPTLYKSLGAISFHQNVETLDALIRGVTPWPSAFVSFRGKRISILKASIADTSAEHTSPGNILNYDPVKKALLVACSKGTLAIHSLKPEGKSAMDAQSFVNGYKPAAGDKFDMISN